MNDAMIMLQKEAGDTLERCRKDFLKAMTYAHRIFGDTAFRKLNANGRYGRINKPLYDAVSVNLAELSEQNCEMLLERKERLLCSYAALLGDVEFLDIITNGTAKIQNVQSRHARIHEIFQEVLADD